jgi:acyl-coenzyme A synthetase/AMP-(fatty) acid ligase
LYWRNDELQRQTVHDGWTLTGDVCVRHADGSFEYVRRADDLIVSAGYKIAPREVEAVLASHPAVARSRVFAAPDPVRGAIAIAEVVPRDGVSITGLAETLQEYSREELASFKCPKRILVVGELVRR